MVLPILELLTGLPRVLEEVHSSKSVLVLELLRSDDRVVNEPETGRLAASERGPETENYDSLGVLEVVHLGELLHDLRLWDVRSSRVKDVDDELLPLKKPVGHELSGPDSARLVRHYDRCSSVLAGDRLCCPH